MHSICTRIAATRTALPLAALALALASLALYARGRRLRVRGLRRSPRCCSRIRSSTTSTPLLASLSQIFHGYFPREEPLLLRDVSWALDARLFGFRNPVGYHLGNVLLNAANVALLFLVPRARDATRRRRLRDRRRLRGASRARRGGDLGDGPQGHALGVLRARRAARAVLRAGEPDPKRRRRFYLATLLCTGLALFSKIAAFPCVAVLALHRTFQPYLDGSRAPELPLAVARRSARSGAADSARGPHDRRRRVVPVRRRGVRRGRLARARTARPAASRDRRDLRAARDRLLSRLAAVDVAALGLLPLAARRDRRSRGGEKLAAVAIALAIVAAVAYCCLRRRDLAFFALAFLALLFPYMNVVFVDIWRADRYFYLASFCALAIPALLLAQLGARSSRVVRIAIAAGVVVFALGSAVQTLGHEEVWRDSDSLWQHEAALDEPSLLALQSVATATVKRAEKETDPARRRELALQARSEIERGLARDRALGRVPAGYATSEPLQVSRLHTLLGRSGALLGESLEAQLAHYETAHAIAPDRASAYHLAELNLQLSERAPEADRERLVRKSWAYFLEYVTRSGRDPVQRERSDGIITADLREAFPVPARRDRRRAPEPALMWRGKRVSVVLPTYNEKDSIRRCIEEFEATGVVDEIIVVNNNAAPRHQRGGRRRRARARCTSRGRATARRSGAASAKRPATSSSSPSPTAPSAPATCASCSPTPRTSRSSTAAAP